MGPSPDRFLAGRDPLLIRPYRVKPVMNDLTNGRSSCWSGTSLFEPRPADYSARRREQNQYNITTSGNNGRKSLFSVNISVKDFIKVPVLVPLLGPSIP